MASDLYTDQGDDGYLWIMSSSCGTAIARCWEKNGEWFAAEGDSLEADAGPFNSLDELVDYVETNQLFGPWGNPGA